MKTEGVWKVYRVSLCGRRSLRASNGFQGVGTYRCHLRGGDRALSHWPAVPGGQQVGFSDGE